MRPGSGPTPPRGASALAISLSVSLAASVAPAVRAETRLVFTSEVEGRLAAPVCDGDRHLAPEPFGERVAPAVAAAAAQGAILLDTGSLFALHGLVRFAAERDPEAIAEVVAGLGYSGLALATADLAAPRESALAVWRALQRKGVALLATNLRCEARAQAVCEALTAGEPALLTRGGVRVALLATLRGDALSRVDHDGAAGLSIEEPAAALARATRRARELGATVVVALVEGPGGAGAASHVLQLARTLPADARPDVLLGAKAGEELLFARPLGVRPAVVAAAYGGATELRIRAPDGEDLDLLARPLPMAPSGTPAAPALATFAARVGPGYCSAWGRRPPGGHLARPLDATGALQLAMAAARAEAHAEVAVVNRGAVDPGFRPANPTSLTASDAYLALPFDEPIEVAAVSGDWLAALAKGPAAAGLHLLGVSADGKTVLGRALDPRATYRVATLRFLAQGGNGALAPGPAWALASGITLRAALLRLLDRPSGLDPREAVPQPAEAVIWTLRPDVDARLALSTISNPGGYGAAPLQRSDARTLGLEVTLGGVADAQQWLWENTGALRFRHTLTTNANGSATISRDDLETVRSTLTLRDLAGPQGWYLPQPYVEAYGESEVAATDGVGDRRWLLRGSLGARLVPHAKLALKLAVALEERAGSGGSKTLPGLNAQVAMLPWEVARFGGRRVEIDGTLDAFGGGEGPQLTVRAHAGLLIDLIGPLAFVFAADLYAERDGGGPAGVSLDTTAGLRVRILDRISTF
jgi:hypothetical protein